MSVLTATREVNELRYSKMLRDNDDERTRLADFGSINHKTTDGAAERHEKRPSSRCLRR